MKGFQLVLLNPPKAAAPHIHTLLQFLKVSGLATYRAQWGPVGSAARPHQPRPNLDTELLQLWNRRSEAGEAHFVHIPGRAQQHQQLQQAVIMMPPSTTLRRDTTPATTTIAHTNSSPSFCVSRRWQYSSAASSAQPEDEFNATAALPVPPVWAKVCRTLGGEFGALHCLAWYQFVMSTPIV